MAATITPDRIEYSSESIQRNALGNIIRAQIERSCLVEGIELGSSDPENTLSYARAAVEAVYAPASYHPVVTQAQARSYRAIPINSNNSCYVVISYIYDPHWNPTEYEYRASVGLQSEQTDAEFDGSGNLVPIRIPYNINWQLKKSDGSIPTKPSTGDEPCFGVATVLRPYKTWEFSKTIYGKDDAEDADEACDAYVGKINSTSFRGKPANTVMFLGSSVVFRPYEGKYAVAAQFGYRPQGWQEWLRATHSQHGTPPNMWRNDDPAKCNGYKKVNGYLTADLNAVLTILGIS